MDIDFIRLNIKTLRRISGITQKDMANRLFMDQRTYAKIERGEKKSIDITLLASIADILKTDITALLQAPRPLHPFQDTPFSLTAITGQFSQKEYTDLLLELKSLKVELKEMMHAHKQILELLKTTV